MEAWLEAVDAKILRDILLIDFKTEIYQRRREVRDENRKDQ